MAQGEASAVDGFLAWAADGPPGARVDRLTTYDEESRTTSAASRSVAERRLEVAQPLLERLGQRPLGARRAIDGDVHGLGFAQDGAAALDAIDEGEARRADLVEAHPDGQRIVEARR